MRTTLDIDDGILRVARVLAQQSGVSLGRAISDLARRGLDAGHVAPSEGFPLLPHLSESHTISSDLVAEHRDDAP